MSAKAFPVWGWLILGILVAATLVVGAVGVLTRTEWGREQALELTIGLAGNKLQGELNVERADGNLLAGAQLYGISLRGNDGQPLLIADSGYIDYDLRTILSDRTVIDRVVLYNPRLFLRRMPGDTAWNFQQILQDTASRGPGTRSTVLDRVVFINGDVIVRQPWEPDPELRGAARQRAIREAVEDTVRLMVDSVPGGYVRTTRYRNLDGVLGQLVLGPEAGGGTYVEVERLEGLAYLYREPARIRQARGEVYIREGRTEIQIDTLLLPNSKLSGYGVVRAGDSLQYDFVLHGDTVAFRDLQWLYPGFPERGGGEIRLTIEERAEGLLLHARELRMSAPGTRLWGGFGVLLGDTVRFFDVNLNARPIDINTVERMLPTELPVRGLRIGSAEIGQPITSPR